MKTGWVMRGWVNTSSARPARSCKPESSTPWLMLILLAFSLLLLTPLVMLIISFARPGFAYHWLVAALAAVLAWPMVVMAGLHLPQVVMLPAVQQGSLFSTRPFLYVDAASWPLAVAVVTLVLGVILTAVARLQDYNGLAWAGTLLLGGLGLLSVTAGNLLTLLLTWASLDITELVVLLTQVKTNEMRERAVVAFSVRATGILLLITAEIIARANGATLNLTALPPQASILLLIAAGMRLGVLPLNLPFFQVVTIRRGLGSSLRLIPAAASLMLLVRVANPGIISPLAPYLLALAALAAVYAGSAWITSPTAITGRVYWILGMAALAVASAIRGQPAAALAWSLACIFSGGLLFLASIRSRVLLGMAFLGALWLSALPFTPTWAGLGLYSEPFSPGMALILPFFLLAQALLLWGYIRHILNIGLETAGPERWIYVIYPVGIALFPIVHLGLGLWMLPNLAALPSAAWWGGPVVAGLTAVAWLLSRRRFHLPARAVQSLRIFSSLSWIYRMFWSAFRTLQRVVRWTTTALEGEGGILWAFVLLALLLSILVGGSGG